MKTILIQLIIYLYCFTLNNQDNKDYGKADLEFWQMDSYYTMVDGEMKEKSYEKQNEKNVVFTSSDYEHWYNEERQVYYHIIQLTHHSEEVRSGNQNLLIDRRIRIIVPDQLWKVGSTFIVDIAGAPNYPQDGAWASFGVSNPDPASSMYGETAWSYWGKYMDNGGKMGQLVITKNDEKAISGTFYFEAGFNGWKENRPEFKNAKITNASFNVYLDK